MFAGIVLPVITFLLGISACVNRRLAYKNNKNQDVFAKTMETFSFGHYLEFIHVINKMKKKQKFFFLSFSPYNNITFIVIMVFFKYFPSKNTIFTVFTTVDYDNRVLYN
jgi:CRISPR/Cas system-associated protein Cas5 (RAMP superfamily)